MRFMKHDVNVVMLYLVLFSALFVTIATLYFSLEFSVMADELEVKTQRNVQLLQELESAKSDLQVLETNQQKLLTTIKNGQKA